MSNKGTKNLGIKKKEDGFMENVTFRELEMVGMIKNDLLFLYVVVKFKKLHCMSFTDPLVIQREFHLCFKK